MLFFIGLIIGICLPLYLDEKLDKTQIRDLKRQISPLKDERDELMAEIMSLEERLTKIKNSLQEHKSVNQILNEIAIGKLD